MAPLLQKDQMDPTAQQRKLDHRIESHKCSANRTLDLYLKRTAQGRTALMHMKIMFFTETLASGLWQPHCSLLAYCSVRGAELKFAQGHNCSLKYKAPYHV